MMKQIKQRLADFAVIAILIGASLIVTFTLMRPNTTIEEFEQKTELAKEKAFSRREGDKDLVRVESQLGNPAIPKSNNTLSDEVYSWQQLLLRDSIAPIYDPSFVAAEEALLEGGELVIGVAINGEAKAYPIGPLNGREMVNDVVGGVPVLVTW